MSTKADFKYDEHENIVIARFLFPEETALEDIPAILRAAADKLDSVEDYVDLDNLEPLSAVAKRNRRMLDRIVRDNPSAAFQRPIGNGEL